MVINPQYSNDDFGRLLRFKEGLAGVWVDKYFTKKWGYISR